MEAQADGRGPGGVQLELHPIRRAVIEPGRHDYRDRKRAPGGEDGEPAGRELAYPAPGDEQCPRSDQRYRQQQYGERAHRAAAATERPTTSAPTRIPVR